MNHNSLNIDKTLFYYFIITSARGSLNQWYLKNLVFSEHFHKNKFTFNFYIRNSVLIILYIALTKGVQIKIQVI